MTKTLIFAMIFLSIFLGFQQAYSAPEIDDEVIVGFENEDTTATPRDLPAQIDSGQKAAAIPDWVRTTMGFYLDGQISEREMLDAFNYLFENNIMHISQEAAQEVQDLRDKVEEQASAISSLRTLVSTQAMSGGEKIMQPEYGVGLFVSQSELANEIVNEVLTKGGTASAWEEGIALFSQQEMRESVIPELAGIVVLCNNEIDKKTQSIDAELKILEHWLEIISEKQESYSSDDANSRLEDGSTTKSSQQYNESDLEFISRNLSSIDQRIMALDTGIKVFEEKLQSVGEDAQLANIDLQNSLQKQQQTLQTMSNVSKTLHDTAMSVIRKIG